MNFIISILNFVERLNEFNSFIHIDQSHLISIYTYLSMYYNEFLNLNIHSFKMCERAKWNKNEKLSILNR